MRAVCRSICERYAVARRRGHMYALGFGRCPTCDMWFDLSVHVKCPCCSRPIRSTPKAKKPRDGQPVMTGGGN